MSSNCPPLLSACELTAIRAAAELSLDTPVTVTPVTGYTSTAGGYTETTGTAVACNARFTQPSAPLLTNYADKIGHLQTWLVALPISVLPHAGDTITITSDGSVYTVHAVLDPQSFNTLNRVLAGKA